MRSSASAQRKAQDALVHFLLTSQWCYSTNKDSLY